MYQNMDPWFNKRWDDGLEMPVLRVPLFTQPQTEPECLPHSLKMCIEYFKNVYPDNHIRQHTQSVNYSGLNSLSDNSIISV